DARVHAGVAEILSKGESGGEGRAEGGALHDVGQWEVGGEEKSGLREAVGGGNVAGERRGRQRICDGAARQKNNEIAGAFGDAGDDIVEGRTLAQARALVVDKEEYTVLPDGATDRAAELITLERLAVGHEEVARVELLVAQKLEEISVEGIGAAFERG